MCLVDVALFIVSQAEGGRGRGRGQLGFVTCLVLLNSCFLGLDLPFHLGCPPLVLGCFTCFFPRSTPGLLPVCPLGCCCWLPAVLRPLVLEEQEEASSAQLCPLPSPGDVGSFVLKLVEGLQGQTWAPDWVEELREADRQKEQTFRWGLGGVDVGRGFPADTAASAGDLRCPVAGRRQRCLWPST